MKRILSTSVIGLMVALAISSTARGQLALSEIRARKGRPFYMNLVMENAADPTYYSHDNNSKITNITTRAIRHFLINFSEVSNERWYSTPDMFVAMFKLSDIDHRVDYDKKGNWIEIIRTYDETRLPADVWQSVKSSYPDYHIYLVREIELPLQPLAYVIHLESKTKLINLQVCNGAVQEWQKFDKSK